MDYDLAPPLVSSTHVADKDDAEQTPYELGASRLLRLRKHQSVAGIAASRSTLSAHSRSTSQGDDTGWQSDEDMSSSHLKSSHSVFNARSLHKGAFRSKRRSSIHRPESSNISSSKHTTRHTPSGTRITVAKSEQRWISMLERNSEELMSQIQTLTSDANQIEQRLRAQLEAAENEISSLKEQLADRDATIRHANERYARIRLDKRLAKTESSNTASNAAAEDSARHAMLRLHREKELLLSRCQKQDGELLRLKKRNAELAEKILHQRGLEITVDGQHRYLQELAAALEESRRGSTSDAASSPELHSSSPYSEGAAFSLLNPVTDSRANERPVSFDGTRWQKYSHLRNLSFPDIELPLSHKFSELPLSPPLTETESSPLREFHCPRTDESLEQKPDRRRFEQTQSSSKMPIHRPGHQNDILRPILQRNESSLWAELHEELDATDLTSRRTVKSSVDVDANTTESLATIPGNRVQTTQSELRHMRQRSQTVVAQMVRIKGDAMTNGLRVVLCGWVWLCFLCLLSVSVARVISEGPLGIDHSDVRLGPESKKSVESSQGSAIEKE